MMHHFHYEVTQFKNNYTPGAGVAVASVVPIEKGDEKLFLWEVRRKLTHVEP